MTKMSNATKTRLVKPKTKKGERVLKEREPQLVSLQQEELFRAIATSLTPKDTLRSIAASQVETSKKVLLLYGNKPSQVIKVRPSELSEEGNHHKNTKRLLQV